MSKLRLAAQLYTLREQMQTPEGIREGLRRVGGMGYTSVQVSAIGAIEPERLRDLCVESGLAVCATHTPFAEILDDTKAVAERHKIIGCPLVGLGHGGEYVGEPTVSSYGRLAKKLNEAGGKLRAFGLRFAYHNHNAEFRRLDNGMTGYDFLVRETDPELVGFILDTYWVQAGGASPVEYIRRLQGRIEVIHFKDMAVDDQCRPQIAEIGGGNLNWHDIIAACEETGVRTAAVEQDTCPRDPFDCLRSSYDYLHGQFGLQ